MSKKTHQFWIVYSYHPALIDMTQKEFHYLTYHHDQKCYVWSNIIEESHCFVSKIKANEMAQRKGGKVELHPRSRYE